MKDVDIRVLIDRLCALNMSLGVLCAIRTMLANLKFCRNTLDAIQLAEEVLAEKEMQLHEELMEVLGLAERSSLSNTSFESSTTERKVEEDTG